MVEDGGADSLRAFVQFRFYRFLVLAECGFQHLAGIGVRLENGNFPTLSVLSLTSDFVPLSANP